MPSNLGAAARAVLAPKQTPTSTYCWMPIERIISMTDSTSATRGLASWKSNSPSLSPLPG
jgi:hypothetical protein